MSHGTVRHERQLRTRLLTNRCGLVCAITATAREHRNAMNVREPYSRDQPMAAGQKTLPTAVGDGQYGKRDWLGKGL